MGKQGGQGGQKDNAIPVNLISMDSKASSGNDYQKYYKSYTPEVKNWSNKEEVRDAFMTKYAGSYTNLNAMDSKNGGGDAYRSKYAGKYLPADVKNWSDQQDVSDAFAKKYGGSYINLNAMDSKNGDGDAYRSKYASKYLPADVKNWSDQQEVRDVFTKKYAGSSVSLNAVNSKQDAGSHDAGADTNLDAVKSDNSFNGASVQLSASRSNAYPPSASVPPLSLAASNRLAETDAAIVTASREA